MDILYTGFKDRKYHDSLDVYHIISCFGITQIPFVDTTKIREFNTLEMSQKTCLEVILNSNYSPKLNI